MEKPTHGLLTAEQLAARQEAHDHAMERREIAQRQAQALDAYYGAQAPEPGSLWPMLMLAVFVLAVAILWHIIG
jgi:hypothetical protein